MVEFYEVCHLKVWLRICKHTNGSTTLYRRTMQLKEVPYYFKKITALTMQFAHKNCGPGHLYKLDGKNFLNFLLFFKHW